MCVHVVRASCATHSHTNQLRLLCRVSACCVLGHHHAAVCVQVGRRRDQYKRCANLLEAVSQLLEHFSHYQDMPKIQALTKRLETVQVRPGGALGVRV